MPYERFPTLWWQVLERGWEVPQIHQGSAFHWAAPLGSRKCRHVQSLRAFLCLHLLVYLAVSTGHHNLLGRPGGLARRLRMGPARVAFTFWCAVIKNTY